jgi:hypothetical protein
VADNIKNERPNRVPPVLVWTWEVIPIPALARAKEHPSENLSLEEQIQRRAYELYVERGNQSGSEFDDWLQAEAEILESQEQALAAER